MGHPSGNPHDPRTFRQFARLADDGTVLAVIEVADGSPDPEDDEGSPYMDVTALPRDKVAVLTVKRQAVQAIRQAIADQKAARDAAPTESRVVP